MKNQLTLTISGPLASGKSTILEFIGARLQEVDIVCFKIDENSIQFCVDTSDLRSIREREYLRKTQTNINIITKHK